MTSGRRAAIVAAMGRFATVAAAGSAQAEPHAAFAPYLTPGPNGWLVNGDVHRDGDTCGNASAVANVCKETGWFDELAASFEQTFAWEASPRPADASEAASTTPRPASTAPPKPSPTPSVSAADGDQDLINWTSGVVAPA
ncbi:MAG: hypothetical protein WBA97_00605 [Actinophytocola sp.]|uniref:hypothetical protein n=1 Tax=Actinophytocola sp. TaxID=1872138 RepID=UPI003C78E1B5